jgi:hypothetical protein
MIKMVSIFILCLVITIAPLAFSLWAVFGKNASKFSKQEKTVLVFFSIAISGFFAKVFIDGI